MVNAAHRLAIAPDTFLPRAGSPPVAWRISDALVGYDAAMAWMEARADAIARGLAPECVWLLEHPALYTAG
ncbi:lipoate-protein ligase B, partial [Methylobacterium sp. WL122]